MAAADDFMDEFTREDGFFLGLHQRQFDPVAAERALQILRLIEIGTDHGTNYLLADHMFQADFELRVQEPYNRDNKQFERYHRLFFDEIAMRFVALGSLGETLRKE
ncbi:hypothetical protein ACFSOZ_36580 [Mesorhizobium newzealandense]|uniref:Uncharacterized protein n=1 Tax=Mesorhizobium newzealandense TaxID=1300302 RepID=A0ABW4UNJ7_9HYPH